MSTPTFRPASTSGTQMKAHVAKGDEPLPALIPQYQSDAFEALPQREPADGRELRIFAQRMRQLVERNAAAQMMHVVHPDIGREPAQNTGQVVMRAAVQRGLVQIPTVVVGPGRVLELVLDVE